MGNSRVHDASFYEFVAHVIQQQQDADDTDRRDRDRRAYTPVQLIAPLKADGLPDADQFKPMTCHDLSVSGFSFVTDEPPVEDKLVVALGVRPDIAYLVAQVMHRTPVETPQGYDYLVGCRFLKRIHA